MTTTTTASDQSGARRLRAVPPPNTRKTGAASQAPLGVVGQVRTACRPGNRLATLLGGFLGGGVPIAAWQLAHGEIDPGRSLFTQIAAWLVLGGLLFSAATVLEWGRAAFGSGVKALGFTLLLEGVLTCAHTPWLSVAGLVYLVAINAVATGVRLSAKGS